MRKADDVIVKNVAVYLGSSGRCRDVFKTVAGELGDRIGDEGKELVYGGMDSGLMGIVANHALAHGAHVTGVIPKSLKDSERIHPKLTQTILVNELWERKAEMFRRADAIVNVAGGFGTIDEALEVLHWAGEKSHNKPIAFMNTENYWDDFIAYIQNAPDLVRDQLIVAQNPQEIMEALAAWPKQDEPQGDEDHLPHYEDIILADEHEPLIFRETSIKESYILATALGLKQLGRHNRPIGILNDAGQFDLLLRWIDKAQDEHFLTDRCKLLFDVDSDEGRLRQKMAHQGKIELDLHHEKWGPSETPTHIEIREI